MFKRRRDWSGPELLSKGSTRRRIQARFAQILIHLHKSDEAAAHVATESEASAFAHATKMTELAKEANLTVVRLRATDAEDVRAKAYQADVVVGTHDDFAADLGQEEALGIPRNAVIVEGKSDKADALKAAYQKAVSA